MRRTNLCLVKTAIAILIAVPLGLMLSNWFVYPDTSDKISKKLLVVEEQVYVKYQKVQSITEKLNNIELAQHDHNIDTQSNWIKIDWHDKYEMSKDLARRGIGEQGKSANVIGQEARVKEIFDQNGYNGFLSDQISLNRSLPDIRNEGCKTKKYLKKLPTVSIVIPFYNEHWSTLLRSVYSILNRSPPELLHEIILVDDCSDKDSLKDNLDEYVSKHLPKVKVIRQKERSGLIVARIAGAKLATAEVLIFLDSHIEANYNWLPPLLEPIAINPKASVCPFIDVIDHDSFEYRAQDEGARGAFDWEFYYKRLPLLPEDLKDKTKPFRSPIMAGGLFAISTKFFWDLGGYDEGLDIWGGEQYELSFKIWMCGGELLDAPCSRVGHIYRGTVAFRNPRKTDYLHKNYKRVAEVWMDEYAKYLYKRNQNRYDSIDPGNLTKQKAIRERLHCKTFKWFMEEIAFDLVKKYPPVEPPDFAHGVVRSLANPLYCLDTLNNGHNEEIGLYSCADDSINPQSNQNWELSWHKDLRVRYKRDCLDVSKSTKNAPVIMYECHGQLGNQYWSYQLQNKWLVHGKNMRCLEANIQDRKVYINDCDHKNLNMKWEFGYVNVTALENFHLLGILDDGLNKSHL